MGAYAARCMLTHEEKGDEEHVPLDICFDIFTHCTRFFGYKVALLGLYNAQGLDTARTETLLRVQPRTDKEPGEYAKVRFFVEV